MAEPFLALITPVGGGGTPTHPIYEPPYPSHGPGFPTNPIVIPPDAISPGVPSHPIYLPPSIWPSPGHPAHPIVIPPGAIGPGVPTHPIVLPPPAHPSHPIVIPPGAISPGVPTHPIVLPPLGIWGGAPPYVDIGGPGSQPGPDQGLPVPPSVWPPEPIPPLPPALESQTVVAVHRPGQDWVVKTYPTGPDQGLPEEPPRVDPRRR